MPVASSNGSVGLSFGGVEPADLSPIITYSRRWVIIFCAIEQVGAYRDVAPGRYVRGGWWDKTTAPPQFTGDRPASPGEAIVFFHAQTKKQWHGGGHKAAWSGPSSQAFGQEMRVHETQKPLWLMRRLIELFTDPGELVWDPYAGSSTTGVACLQLGRKFIGHEAQSHYFDASVERLEAAEQGLTLKAYRAGQIPLL